MNDIVRKFKQSFSIAGIIAVLAIVLNYGLRFLKLEPSNMSIVGLKTGLTTSAGNSIIHFLDGILPISLNNLIALYIAAFAVVFIGLLVFKIEFLQFKIKNRMGRLALALFYGTIVLGMIMVMAFKIPTPVVMAQLAVYYVILSYFIVFIVDKTKIKVDLI